jgi:hypothetical protein
MGDLLFEVEIAETEIRIASIGLSLAPIRDWWEQPFARVEALRTLCQGGEAEKIIVDGIRHAASKLRDSSLKELMLRYLDWAVRLTADPNTPTDQHVPLWIHMIRDIGHAGSCWEELCAQFIVPDVKQDFILDHWDHGAGLVRGGYPRAAALYWQDNARRVHERTARRTTAFLADSRLRREAHRLAVELGIASPPCEESVSRTPSIAMALQNWRDNTLSHHLDRCFWGTTGEGLAWMRSASELHLSAVAKRRLTQLLKSSERAAPPGFTECQGICNANGEATDVILAEITKRLEESAESRAQQIEEA